MLDLRSFVDSGTVVSSSKGKLLIGWGKRVYSSEPIKGEPPSFFFPDFFLTDPAPWFTHENVLECSIAEFLHILQCFQKPVFKKPVWEKSGKEFFTDAYQKLQALFKSHTLKKGVPFAFETAKESISSEKILFLLKNTLAFAEKNPVFIYGTWEKNEGIIGATPEILCKIFPYSEGFCLDTVACAGTFPKERAEFLPDDPKNLHEHRLVVEGIVQSLQPFGKVSVGKLTLLKLQDLAHLVTNIELKKETSLDALSVIKALHPSPALGAFPKEAGAVWLKSLQEKEDRARFGAPAGFWREGKASCFYVAIRNVQWFKDGKLKIAAGCGVVPESCFNLEWDEVNLKIHAIKNIIGL